MSSYTSEMHWVSSSASLQVIQRQGFENLYIVGTGGRSCTFYDANDMAMWLLDQGVDSRDPIWDYIEMLPSN